MSKGQYFYARHRRMWGIWKRDNPNDSASSGTFVKDCITRDEAVAEVYRLNGWKLKVTN